MSALNAKPSSSLNGIKYISRSILAILELQNVRNAEEKGFAREKINGIFFVSTPCKRFLGKRAEINLRFPLSAGAEKNFSLFSLFLSYSPPRACLYK
jgi:hypothetical protein